MVQSANLKINRENVCANVGLVEAMDALQLLAGEVLLSLFVGAIVFSLIAKFYLEWSVVPFTDGHFG